MGAHEYGLLAGRRVYVDNAATNGLDNGSSWDNAFVHLQDALTLLARWAAERWRSGCARGPICRTRAHCRRPAIAVKLFNSSTA